MAINPVQATYAIEESYRNYLTTTFGFKDLDLQKQFIEQLQQPGKFLNGPILEATPSFKTGLTIEKLIDEGILSKEFRSLNAPSLPLDRTLYLHQEKAIRKVVSHKRNIVVATGTGSGKTETFLIPILDYLLKEQEVGRLSPGVRALLLYPMNALANDQMLRLRTLLKNYPYITFGRYTGETENEYSKALSQYRNMFHSDPIPNELISREQMRKKPPHILLTNYAMLEYLLLRPKDNVFFDGIYAKYWHFIVMDEVHTYSGAKGIEMAMLLRRLKERIVQSEPGRLQCIATSATLGRGREDFPQIVHFASQMFGEPFEWVETDPLRQDVIEGERIPMIQPTVSWGEPEVKTYQHWKKIIDSSEKANILDELIEVGKRRGVPEIVLSHAVKQAKGGNWKAFLYYVLRGDGRLHQLQHELQKGPKQLFEIAQKIMKDVLNPEESLVALVDLASQAKADDFSLPLLPARYHVFIRAIEGAYLSLSRHKKLFLERRETNLVDGRKYTVFEIATCRWCGSVYLVGQREEGESGISYLKQPNHELQKVEYFLLAESEIQINEGDEDDEVSFPDIGMSLNKEDSYILCGSCGAIEKEGFLGKLCKCEENNLYRLLKVPSNEEDKVCSCPKCGRRSPKGIVWRFLVGNDAAASVLCTALYQQIKPKKQDLSQVIFHQEEEYDPWNPIEQVSSSATHHIQTEAPRKLLVFSDSRQDAAFFAPYLNRTYNQIMYRSIIVKALLEYRDEIVKNQWRLQDLVDPVYEIAKETEVLEGKSIQERKSEVWRWILHEFLTLDKWVNLEGLGLLHFSLVQPDHWVAPKPLMDPPWNMTKEEVWTLFQVLLDTIRSKGAVVFPKWISPKDEFFQPRNREFYIRAYQSNGKKGILCWNSERLNGRIDYLIRLAGRLNPELTEEDCRSLLRDLWDRCLFRKPGGGLWKGYFHPTNLPGEGVVYQMGYDVWEILSPLVQKDSKWYRCNKCHVITPYNIRGSCISYRCDGELQQCSPEEVFQNNHYYRLYMTTMPYRMQAQEHTAQLTSQAAAELQNMFIEGAVNILSCSTTFELGVDVGELETVFMRNMPPSAANYIQRAGRAGRRADSTAFVLTFAQRRSHDLTHFHEPWRMVSGEIRAPYFSLDNMKIILRHVFATALSAFWSHNEKYFGTVEDFFFGEEGTGSKRLRDFLSEKPLDLQESIRRIVPRHLHDKIGIQNWDWLKYLKGEDGVLYKTEKELEYDVKQIEEVREQLYKQKRDTDHLLRLLNTIKGRDILSFMSSHNIIPKYGFPVDVVELQLYHHHEEAKRLQLERDLRIALSEYAPGSQVVASGNLWTSRYIKRPPTKAWDRYRYVICTNCKSYHRIRAELLSEENSNPFSVCPLCKSKLTTHQGDFIVPSFGFIASIDQPGKPGEQRPEKTYTTRVYYSGQAVEDTSIRLALNGVVIHATSASHGRLAVINNGKGKGFKVCYQCGFAALDDEKVQYPHPNYWGGKCWEKLSKRLSLGHEFETDILKLYFEGFSDSREGFWLSMLYALLEGASEALDIERNDLNGCLYPMEGDPSRPTIILFDDVPGGAGHVRRIAQRNILKEVLRATYYKLSRCDCGGEDGNASCYGCLRNYYNQFCHGQLNRGMVMDFLKKIMAEDLTDHRGIAGIA